MGGAQGGEAGLLSAQFFGQGDVVDGGERTHVAQSFPASLIGVRVATRAGLAQSLRRTSTTTSQSGTTTAAPSSM